MRTMSDRGRRSGLGAGGPAAVKLGAAGLSAVGLGAAGLILASVMGACAGGASRDQVRSDTGAARDAAPGTGEEMPRQWPSGRETVEKERASWPTQSAPMLVERDRVEDDGLALAAARAMPELWGRVQASADIDMVAGTLVAINGRNVLDGDDLRLGIAPVTRANDPAAIGAAVAPGLSAFDRTLEGRRASRGVGREGDIVIGAFAHEVATSGVARLWVVEEAAGRDGFARDLAPGDLLVSADAPGCAMLDNTTRFEVGYVVARVAEHASWNQAAASDTGSDGRRRMLVTVMIERFVRPPLNGLSRAELLTLQQRELERWQDDWERDASRRYRWDDMSRTWDEMDRFKKRWGEDWDDDKTWRELRDSTRRMREQDDQLKRLRDDLDKSRRELEDTRRNLDDLSRDVKGGRNDTGSRGGSSGGVKPAPR